MGGSILGLCPLHVLKAGLAENVVFPFFLIVVLKEGGRLVFVHRSLSWGDKYVSGHFHDWAWTISRC